MPKLTLSVDPAIASRAKRYARRNGTSVSRMVETYLTAVTEPSEPKQLPPILRKLRGSLKDADVADYYRYLEEKYR